MSVRLARPLAEAVGLVLARPDPDGPPLADPVGAAAEQPPGRPSSGGPS
jgi:hypothetical protein